MRNMRRKIPHPNGGMMEVCYCPNCLRGHPDQCLCPKVTTEQATIDSQTSQSTKAGGES